MDLDTLTNDIKSLSSMNGKYSKAKRDADPQAVDAARVTVLAQLQLLLRPFIYEKAARDDKRAEMTFDQYDF
jgi:hypothetical protein